MALSDITSITRCRPIKYKVQGLGHISRISADGKERQGESIHAVNSELTKSFVEDITMIKKCRGYRLVQYEMWYYNHSLIKNNKIYNTRSSVI